MTRGQIIEKLRAMEPELRARGITRMQMFGSRARGDNRDLDLLIACELPDAVSAFDVFSIGPDLTDVLGIETQMIQKTIRMKSRLRERIADDLLQVF